MSHFTCLVILPAEFELPARTTRADRAPLEIPDRGLAGFFEARDIHNAEAPPPLTCINDAIAELIAPYDENADVEPYDQSCSCGEWRLRGAQRRIANAICLMKGIPTIDELRKQYWSLDEEERSQELWDEMIAPRCAVEQLVESWSFHPQASAPDPACEECHGTGTYQSTYNPNSKWDWWRIGGRWDGYIKGPDVAESRETDNGFNFSNDNQHWENNTAQLKTLLFGDELVWVPFAIVTPAGEWLESGNMGWWGVVIDEKPHNEWHDTVRAVYQQYAEHFGVVVDCHI